MLNEYGGFLCLPLRCSQITPSPFLLFEGGLTDKFPKPSLPSLNNSMGLFAKIEIPSFWKSFCWLRNEVFRKHLLRRTAIMEGRENDPMTFKRNLHFFGVPLLINGSPGCLLFRQTRGQWCNIAPWNLVFDFYSSIQHFNRKSAIGAKPPREFIPWQSTNLRIFSNRWFPPVSN